MKEGLFTTAAHAGALTGRFRIAADGDVPALHVQLRDGACAHARHARTPSRS